MAIVRDSNGIVVQHDPNDPNYMDGGDSARVTGLLSLVGNDKDRLLCSFFVNSNNLGVRHPWQSRNNNDNPNNFTRDQLICLMAGLNKSALGLVAAKDLFYSHAKRLFFCQNTHDQQGNKKPWYKSRDPLHPGHIGLMIQAAQIYLSLIHI